MRAGSPATPRPLTRVAGQSLLAESARPDPFEGPRGTVVAPVARGLRLECFVSPLRSALSCWASCGLELRRRRRRPVQEPALPLKPVAGDPLRASALAHAGGLGRRERPPPLKHPQRHRQTPFRTERSVSVNLHPVPSLGELSGFSTAQPPRRPGWLPHPNNVVRNYS